MARSSFGNAHWARSRRWDRGTARAEIGKGDAGSNRGKRKGRVGLGDRAGPGSDKSCTEVPGGRERPSARCGRGRRTGLQRCEVGRFLIKIYHCACRMRKSRRGGTLLFTNSAPGREEFNFYENET